MNSNSVLERHADLYFPDGDVVLAVKQTSKSDEEPPKYKYTLFRIHKFLLRHHSATFANFFADANAAPTELYDGVPLAEMRGDKAEDSAMLLSYLYNPSSLVFKRNDPNTPLVVSGVIRLADKYLIKPLHRCLVQQVCDDWPTTLNDYDIKRGEVEALKKVATCNIPFQYTPDNDGGRISDIIPEPASAILFAREFGCPQILPAAFYLLSLIPVACDWSKQLTHQPLARWPILDGDSLLKCMHGCQALRQYHPLPSRFLSEGCANAWDRNNRNTPCYRFVTHLLEVVFKGRRWATHGDPLGLLTRCFKYWELAELSEEHCPDRLCDNCEEALDIAISEERKRIWSELPKYFNLG